MAKNSNTYKTFNINERTPEGLYRQLNMSYWVRLIRMICAVAIIGIGVAL